MIADCAVAGESARYWMIDHAGRTVHISRGKVAHLRVANAGQYLIRAAAINRDGVEGAASAPFELTVLDPPPPPPSVAPPSIALPPPPARLAAAPARGQRLPNANFAVDLFSVSLLAARGQSSQQIYQDQPAGTSRGVIAYVLKWFGAHGVEAKLRAPIAAGRDDARVTEVEAGYRYRWLISPRGWFNRPAMISPALGYLAHRSSSVYFFAPRYDLITLGLKLAAPFGRRWSADGDVKYGIGAAASQRFEARLKLSYHLNPTLAVDGGYGVNLFEARSPTHAPARFTPNREGWAEWHAGLGYFF